MLIRWFSLIPIILSFLIFPQVCFGKNVINLVIPVDRVSEAKSISNYFIENPDTDRVNWNPYSEQLERFDFMIPREAFFTALRFQDSSDLYYLSKINDNGLTLSDNTYARVMLKVDADTHELAYSKKLNNSLSVGAQIISGDSYSLGGNFSYNQVLKDSVLLNFDGIIHSNQLSELEIGSVFLTNNEHAEIFFQLNVFDDVRKKVLSIGKTWFDINDFSDFSSSVDFNKKSVGLSLYTELKYKENYFNLGINSVQNLNNPEIYLGFSKVLGNRKNTKYIVQMHNGNNINPKSKSLKKMRIHELPKIWQENVNFKNRSTN